MPIKFRFKTAEEVPAEQKGLYVEKEIDIGTTKEKWYVLDVEGAVDAERFKEFRTNNSRLISEVDTLKRRYEGIEDVDKAKALLAVAGEMETADAANLLKKGGVEKLLDARTAQMKADYEKRLAVESTRALTLLGRLEQVEIDNAAVEAGTKKGLRATAVLDIKARARQVFKLIEGKVVAVEADGKTVRYGKDATTPLTISEWVDQQVSDAPHLFESSSGGGAGGSGSGGAGNGRVTNPWKKETWNMTEQVMLSKTDPARAARLKSEAGVRG